MAGREKTRGAVARAFHEATKHSYASVRRGGHFLDWGNKPHSFKEYEGLTRMALPREIPSIGVSAVDALRAAPSDGEGEPDFATLARLLVYGAGVSRRVTYSDGEVMFFRTYASAGALYPVEVYVVCGELSGLPAGVYHFDPLRDSFAVLREGDYRPFLARVVAGESSVRSAPVVVALSGIPWRTAWKYMERGYRHLFWDAGMILANVLALAGSAGLPAGVVLGFADSEVEALLGLDKGREFPLCLVPMGKGPPVQEATAPPESTSYRFAPLSRRELRFQAIGEVNDAGRLPPNPRAIKAWREGSDGEESGEEAIRPRLPKASPDPLEEVILRRGSARSFGPGAVPVEVLGLILDLAARGIVTDHSARSRLIEPYVVANAVDGLDAGAYRFVEGEFSLVREGDFRGRAAYLCLEQRLAGDAAATVFLMTDLERVLHRFGDRGYRAAQLEAGIVAGRIYLGAYAHRFGATGLTFYDDEVTEFFSPPAAGLACMLVVAVGESPRLAKPGSSR